MQILQVGQMIFLDTQSSVGRLNIKMLSYQYRDPHIKR